MATIEIADTHRTPAATGTPAGETKATPIEPALVDALQRKGLRLESDARQTGRLVIRLQGKLVTATAPLLKKVVEAGQGVRHIDLDLAGLAQTDGIGLAVLVRIASVIAEDGGSLRIINPTAALRTMMTRIHLHHLIDIVDPASSDDLAAR